MNFVSIKVDNSATKEQLIKFMHCSGFDWICDVAFINGIEMVASKMNDSNDLWWRNIEVEGSGFNSLFKGSIKRCTETQPTNLLAKTTKLPSF